MSSLERSANGLTTPARKLVYQVFDTIGQLGLAITHARINTEKGAAIDSFCLTGPDGKKITDPDLLRQLKTNLEEACLIPG